jgi:hypothetical protein
MKNCGAVAEPDLKFPGGRIHSANILERNFQSEVPAEKNFRGLEQRPASGRLLSEFDATLNLLSHASLAFPDLSVPRIELLIFWN